jgi:hypothetical protein
MTIFEILESKAELFVQPVSGFPVNPSSIADFAAFSLTNFAAAKLCELTYYADTSSFALLTGVAKFVVAAPTFDHDVYGVYVYSDVDTSTVVYHLPLVMPTRLEFSKNPNQIFLSISSGPPPY